jgi:hypothetical protein
MTIYIVDIEPVETRYTAQWKQFLPVQIQSHVASDIVVISGGDVPQATTPGAFLNFAGTNNYKSQQMLKISELFASGKVKNGDYFLYTDAWNPTVIQLRYMAELLGVDIRIGGLWHAGSYDPHDFLGRLIGNKPWVRHAEMSMYECYDHNFFATRAHIDLFTNTFWNDDRDIDRQLLHSIRQVGWPMEYLKDILKPYANMEKQDIILFPHRMAPEKQPEIFQELARLLPEYEFVFAQEQQLTKHEYHELLGRSKIVFSANLQETLGISWYEAALVETLPLVPDRLSYSEMAPAPCLYPSEWTESLASFEKNKHKLVEHIRDMMRCDHYETCKLVVKKCDKFFNGEQLYKELSA